MVNTAGGADNKKCAAERVARLLTPDEVASAKVLFDSIPALENGQAVEIVPFKLAGTCGISRFTLRSFMRLLAAAGIAELYPLRKCSIFRMLNAEEWERLKEIIARGRFAAAPVSRFARGDDRRDISRR